MESINRIPIIAGNWKMNMLRSQATELIVALRKLVSDVSCEVVTCVPFTDISCVASAIEGSDIRLGAQNCHWAASGAFTGEISAAMLKELGVSYVILGHSERRQYFGETDQTVNARLKAALQQGIRTIVCVGESLEERESGKTFDVINRQLGGAFKDISDEHIENIVVAYEPIWAIGTGKTATAEQAQEVCKAIRQKMANLYNQNISEALRIQYGGSMNAKNAVELLSQSDIDGGLIGGASLKAADFNEIIKAASNKQ